MKKNNLLKISVIICKSIRVMLITSFIIFTVFFIHFQTNPKYYKNLNSKDSTVKINKSSTTKITLFRESFNLSELTVYARYTRRGGLDINPFRSTHLNTAPFARTLRQ